MSADRAKLKRLRRLERTMMLEVEGESPEWFMRLMRHEAAHAYAYAYQLTRKRKWQRVFGLTSSDTTPDTYRPRPYSHSYVVHLDDWYAQSHPDEDFAETFAVWLTPGLDWRERFRARRDMVVSAINAIPGLSTPVPDGAFYCMVDAVPLMDRFGDDAALALHLLDYGVAIVPASAFGGRDGFRISFAADEAKLEEAVRRIAAAVAA